TWTKEYDPGSLGTTEQMAILDNWLCTGTGCAVAVYGSALVVGATSIVSTSCSPSCSTFTSAVNATSKFAIAYSSAEAMSGTLYMVGLASGLTGASTGTLNFFSFTIGGAATSSSVQIETSTAAWQAALCSSSTTLVLFEATTASNTVYARESLTDGGTWYPAAGSTAFLVSTSETSITGLSTAN
ncbi:MAG: hypothetical protein ACRD6W_16135, partial [Nitrososphaerales archaeon]